MISNQYSSFLEEIHDIQSHTLIDKLFVLLLILIFIINDVDKITILNI